MNRCKRCVLPDSRPDTEFVQGVCSACLNYEKRPQIDWDERHRELLRLLDRHSGSCIVPSSGGKDSTYIALTLKELGADVTAVTATTCHLTYIGRKNIDNLSRYVRTIEISPNKTVRAKLNRLGLELVGDISWPEHASIFTVPFRVACDIKTPLIFYGESPQNQYGGPPGTEAARLMTRRWTQEFGGFLGLRPSDFRGMEGITARDMADYELPGQKDMDQLGVEAHFLGQYLPWCSHANAAIAIKHGMATCLPTPANLWDYENLDNAQTGLHDHLMFLKYGYGRGAAQVSVEIRQHNWTREQGLKWIRHRDGLFPFVYMGVEIAEILDRIEMAPEQFENICDQFTIKSELCSHTA